MPENITPESRERDKPPAQAALEKLMNQSKFSRLDRDKPDTTIERDGMQYTIEKIPDGQSELIARYQNLLIKTFGSEEVDPEEVLRAGVDGLRAWGDQDLTKYSIHVVKDSSGEVVSTVAGGRLKLQKPDGSPLGKQMFMVAYAVTDDSARQGGLAREAYISAIMQAAKEAREEGEELMFAAGECTSTSEHFWNSVGWKRAYASKENQSAVEELRYIQPALDFDEHTGEVAAGSSAAAEHLMVDGFGENPTSKEDVLAVVRAFYSWCNTWPQEAFDTPEALQRHRDHVIGIWKKFKEQVRASESIVYMTKEEREKALQQGFPILEHTAADHGDAGEEDF